MAAYATMSELEDRWRPLHDDEKQRATALLDDGSLYIKGFVGHEPEEPELAKVVLINMVKRAMLSPVDQAPLQTYQQMAGPYQEMQTFANPSGDLYLTTSEKKLLGVGRQRMGSIRPAIHDIQGGEIDGW